MPLFATGRQFEIASIILLNRMIKPELGAFEWNILNPDQLINLEIINKRRTSII